MSYNICYNETKEIVMPNIVKLTAIGNSLGIVLPKEILAKFNVEKGDILYVSETPDGIQLTPYDQDFADQREAMRHVMKENRDVLRRLAE
jgi:putative addiction module antidote